MPSQETSYFCLDVDDWRLIGLDTGRRSVHYAGIDLIIALFRHLRWIDRWKTWLPKQIVTWLREDVGLEREDENRGLILLSHHQFYTALDRRQDFPRPGHQIGKMLVRPRRVVWLWGHEHRFASYEGQTSGGPKSRRLMVWGRAVGHSGVHDARPPSIHDLLKRRRRIAKKHLTYTDIRIADPTTGVGYNGFAILAIEGRTLTVDYYAVGPSDDKGQVVLTEKFSLDETGDVAEARTMYAIEDPLFITPSWLEMH